MDGCSPIEPDVCTSLSDADKASTRLNLKVFEMKLNPMNPLQTDGRTDRYDPTSVFTASISASWFPLVTFGHAVNSLRSHTDPDSTSTWNQSSICI